MSRSMRSALYMGKENIAIEDVPIPQVTEYGVLIQNIYSSICGTDVVVYTKGPDTGHHVYVGGEFGHETISRVVEVGRQVHDFHAGQRVYPYPRFAKNDTSKAGTIGGFSEYILVPCAKPNYSLYSVPDEIEDKVACLIEPFTVGCRAARRSTPQKGETAVVFGGGTIGVAAAIALRWFGIQKVMVCDVAMFRLQIIQKLGFEVCDVSHEDFTQKATSYFGSAPGIEKSTADIDIFIDAAGAETVLDIYMEIGKIESRFVSVAVNNAIRKLDLLHLTFAQKSIIGSGGYTPQDVADVIDIMQSKRWDIASIITQEFPLNDIEAAIKTAADPNASLNVVIGFET